MQLRELGFDLEANRCGENRVAEGYLVDLCRGSTPGDCSPEFANHLVEDESLVDSILNDEVPTEAYTIKRTVHSCATSFRRPASACSSTSPSLWSSLTCAFA